MARETSYFVQAFNAGRGGNLKADAPIACKTETGALRTAECGTKGPAAGSFEYPATVLFPMIQRILNAE